MSTVTRHTASTITDDALDALYAELERARAEVERLRAQQAGFFAQMAAARAKSRWFWQRAQAAERAYERVEALAETWRTDGTTPETRLAGEYVRRALEGQQQEVDGELICVDECGWCDACGMEPFGSPAEGWREAARFLRRTPRDSADFPGALRGARLIEAELRRMADGQQQEAAQ